VSHAIFRVRASYTANVKGRTERKPTANPGDDTHREHGAAAAAIVEGRPSSYASPVRAA
jgi:hypothetical protein